MHHTTQYRCPAPGGRLPGWASPAFAGLRPDKPGAAKKVALTFSSHGGLWRDGPDFAPAPTRPLTHNPPLAQDDESRRNGDISSRLSADCRTVGRPLADRIDRRGGRLSVWPVWRGRRVSHYAAADFPRRALDRRRRHWLQSGGGLVGIWSASAMAARQRRFQARHRNAVGRLGGVHRRRVRGGLAEAQGPGR